MYSELKGKVALITGSTKGIGRGIAEKYASLGIKLVLNYSSDEKSAIQTESMLKNYGVEFIIQKADVSDPAAIRELFTVALRHFGKLDIIIANAGVELIERAVIDSTEEDFDRIFNIRWWQAYSCILHDEYTS
jgi:3-oxoacyl-[acyl-carrier protein] reductase